MKKEQPAYLELYRTLREEILAGDWKAGDRLPSRRQLAREYSFSPVTVEHSLELLNQEGYTESRARSGHYVIYRDSDGFAHSMTESAPEPVMKAAGKSSFPFSVLARTMRRVLTEYGEAVLDKSPNEGCTILRRAISRYLGRNRGLRVGEEQILIGSGSEYLYGLVVEALGRERKYAIEYPSYRKIEQVYHAKGVEVDLLPLGSDGIQSGALGRTDATVLHITPFRSYPSGVTASVSKRQEYLRWASSGDRYLVEDDFESEFSLLRKPEETVFSRAGAGNVIYMNTFSRSISPALRAGYMVLSERLAELFSERIGFYSCPVPAYDQYVLAELLNGGDFERHINRIRREERKRKADG